VMAVARAAGISLERLDDYRPEDYDRDDWRPAMERSAVHFQGQVKVKTGVWRDLAVRGRRTEVDCQVGVAVQRGGEVGVDLPLNRCLIKLIHQIEAGERGMAWENFDAFAQLR
jgi:2-dehydropantoate 2-reductase